MTGFETVDVVAGRRDGVVTLEQARRAGLSVQEVHRLCRRGRWRRLSRCTYLIRCEVPDAMLRRARIRAAVTSLGPGAVAVLGTAAELYGLAGLRWSEEIHVSVPGGSARPQRPADAALVVHQLVLRPGDTASVRGLPVTSPVRTLADNLLRADRYDGVSLLDSALNRELLRDEDLAAVASLLRGRRGAAEARGWLAQVDGRAQSPLETRVRLRCADGGVSAECLQFVIRDRVGHLLGVADLAWPGAHLLAEADGRTVHDVPAALHADRRRQNRLTNAGWRILRFTWQDTLTPTHIPTTVRQALSTRFVDHEVVAPYGRVDRQQLHDRRGL